MVTYDVIIIGAGAAGLMCAISAGQRGKSVVILDKASKAAEKIRISGGGRCNFTNLHSSAAHFISLNPHFCKSALAGFTQHDFIAWVQDAGIAYHEREHGQLFCDDSAQQIIQMLLQKCADYQVDIRLNSMVESIAKETTFMVKNSTGDVQSTSLVIATGALSIPKMGATGFGLDIAKQFGLDIVPTRAGLVPFTFTGKEKSQFQALAGISLPVTVQVQGKKRGTMCFKEAMLFTHRGLSGPAMLQISSYWLPGDSLVIDLLPQHHLATYLAEQQQSRPLAQLATALSTILPKRLVALFEHQLPLQHKLKSLQSQDIENISHTLHTWSIKPNGTEGYRTAEVTVGGVHTNELSSQTMQAKKVDGLYFIGEVVDVTGHLGGFNFQWAWSSAYCAGQHIGA